MLQCRLEYQKKKSSATLGCQGAYPHTKLSYAIYTNFFQYARLVKLCATCNIELSF